MIYHIVTIRDYDSVDEYEIGVTGRLPEARRIAREEEERIKRDGEKYETVEIRVYENEDELLDYDTVSREDGNILKAMREKRGLSQNDLAAATGISVRVIQNYEQGTRPLNGARAITVKHIADALGCRMEDLIEE